MTTNGTTPENPMAKMTAEGTARVEQMMDEMKKFEEQQHKRALEMIDESARMMKASIEYSMKLTEEWRKVAMQANKQTMDMLSSAKWFNS